VSKETSKQQPAQRRPWGCLIPALLVILIIIGFTWLLGTGSPAPERAGESGLLADGHSVNVLVVGSDANEAMGVEGRADTIMVVHLDLAAPGIYILSVPRDTLVEVEGYGFDKINHAYAYGGLDLLVPTVEQLLQVPVDYYALTDFAGFEDIVDALGGVEIDVDKRMYYQTYDGLIDIEAGLQRLNGEQALQYVRFRQDELGDITRVSRQQTFLKALAGQMVDTGVLRKLPQLLAATSEMVETDLPVRYVVQLAIKLRSLDAAGIASGTVPGDFEDIDGVSYWRPDETALGSLLNEYF